VPTAPRRWDDDSHQIDDLFRSDDYRQKDLTAVQLTNGDFWLIWSDSLQANAPNFGDDLVGILFDPYGQRKSDRVVLNTSFFAGNEQQPSAAALASGEFVIAFAQERPNGIPADPWLDIVMEKRSAGGAPAASLRITTDANDGDRSYFADPSVAIAGAGNGLVVYERMSSGTLDICFQRFDPTNFTLLSTLAGGVVLDNDRNLTNPRVAVLSSGNYVVAFTSTAANNGADVNSYYRIYTQAGAPVTGFVELNPGGGRESGAEIAVLTGNRFVIGANVTNGILVEIHSNAGALQQSVFVAGGSIKAIVPAVDGGFTVISAGFDFGFFGTSVNAQGQIVGSSVGLGVNAFDGAAAAMSDGRFIFGTLQQPVQGDQVYAVGAVYDTRTAVSGPAYTGGLQFGLPGNDDVDTAAGTNVFHGGSGNDIIRNGSAATTLLMGGDDSDTIVLRGLAAGARARGGDLQGDYDDFFGDTLEMTQETARIFFNMNTGVLSRAGVQATAIDFENYRHIDGGGEDSVVGNARNNYIQTGPGGDTLNGGVGDDILDGGTGVDGMLGGPGNDIYYVDNAGDAVAEAVGEGADMVRASVSFALTDAYESEIETLETTDSLGTTPINLTGNSFNQTIRGNAGANVLGGGGGNDVLVGLGGNDLYFVDNAGDVVTEGAAEGNDRVLASASYALGANASVERLTTTDNLAVTSINLTGNLFSQNIYGNAGANSLDGGGGGDVMVGFEGDDLYIVRHVADRALESANQGFDRVLAAASFTLEADSHVEKLATIDNLAVTAINLTGNALGQYLYGNAGSNTLDGGGGGDVMVGLEGDDRYVVRNIADRAVESAGGGYDRVLAAASFTLEAGSQVELFTTIDNLATTAINLTGNGLAQYLYGNAGSNRLDGGGGGDVLVGFEGDDFYIVRHVADRALESANQGFDRVLAGASFTLEAGSEVETFTTIDNLATTAINLTGNEIDQYLYGNAGANILDGKSGADVLTGFGGPDSFAFTSALGAANVDRITDFQAGIDKIRLDDSIFAALAPGALNPNAYVTGSAATDADDRIIYNQATGQLFYDADGNGAGAAVLFATLQGTPVIAAGDFQVI